MPRAHGLLREAAIAVFFLGLAVVATRPLAADLWGQTLAGPDPLIDLWTVHWLSGHMIPPRELFGGNIYHPDPNAVLYSDLSLGTAILLVPLRLVVCDPVPLYNLAVLLALGFAAWAFHWLARGLTGNIWAGVLAGVLAGFGSHQMSHVYHLNLLTTGWLALLLLALHRLIQRPSWGSVGLAALSFALGAQSSGYYAAAAALLALLFAGWHWRAFRSPRTLAAALAAGLLGVLLLAPYGRAFLALREREGLRRPPGMSEKMAFQPDRDLGSQGFLYRTVLGSGGERLFPGLLSLTLGAVALARRRPHAGFYAAATALLLALSLGPAAFPYRWLFALPPLDSMRHPYTFAAVATLMLSVLAGLGWASIQSRRWMGPLVVAAAVAETLAPAPALRPLPRGLPPAYQRLTTLAPGAALEIPVFAPEALVWAARQRRPVANGIGAFAPRETLRLERAVTNHWIKRTPADVDRSAPAGLLAEHFEVRYLIVPAGRRPALRALAQAMDRSQSLSFVAEVEDGDRIYEFRKERVPLSDTGEGGEEPGEILGQERQPVGHQQ